MGFFKSLFGASSEGGEPDASDAGAQARLEGDGSFSFDIVGESHYQDELEEICGGRTEDSQRLEVEARIIHEDDNPHDDQALRVDVEGLTVGYIDRKNARNIRGQFVEAGMPGIEAVCAAIVVGGWDRGGSDRGHFGVKLDLPTDE